jgi:hypothetical protein
MKKNTIYSGFGLSITILIFMLSVSVSFGQPKYMSSPTSEIADTPSTSVELPSLQSVNSLQNLSLLDPSRFRQKNTIMMNYASVNGWGSMTNTYMKTMIYKFHAPVTLRMHVAYEAFNTSLFNGGDKTGYSGLDNQQVYVPGADLVYKPTDNVTVSFIYRDFRSRNPYGANSLFYSPYSMYSRRNFWGY